MSDFGGSMLNRFSPHIKRMDSRERAWMMTLMGLVAVRSLCETILQYTPMARSKPTLASKAQKNARECISLKTLAEHLGLSKTAVSLVINRVPAARSIPQRYGRLRESQMLRE